MHCIVDLGPWGPSRRSAQWVQIKERGRGIAHVKHNLCGNFILGETWNDDIKQAINKSLLSEYILPKVCRVTLNTTQN